MTVMAFFLLIALCLASFVYFWTINPGEVTVFFTPDHSLTYPFAIVIVGALVCGLLLGFSIYFYSVAGTWFRNLSRNRLEKRSRDVTAIYREGVARLLSGDLKKAGTLLRKALDRDPARVETYLALASVHIQEGDAHKGVALLEKAREIEPGSMEVLFKLAYTFEETGQDQNAIRTYQEILALEKGNRKALRNLRDLKAKQENWLEAYELQKRVLAAIQGSPRIEEERRKHLYLRYEKVKQELEAEDTARTAKVISELQEMLKQDPTFFVAQVTLGDAYRQLGRFDDAVDAWEKGYKTFGKGVFLARLEDHYMDAEDPSSLLAFYREQVMSSSEDLLLRLFYGKLCLRLELIDDALEQLQTLEGSGLDIPQLHLLLAEAYRRRRDVEAAIQRYKKALGIDSRLRMPFVCDACGEIVTEWQSRCGDCGQWGTYVLPGSQQLRAARPPEIRPIHHGER